MSNLRKRLILLLTVLAAVSFTALVVQGVAAAGLRSVDWPVAGAREPSTSPNCTDGDQDSGAVYRICTPVIPWNGDLVVYAHGYVAPDRPVEIPEDQMSLPGFPFTVDQIVNGMGYAFATTSYYTNGLAVLPAISDLLDVVDIFSRTIGPPDRIYLAGVSEGGLITALSVEQYPDVYDGGLAMCGPYGDFRGQINYFGDFRVVFDYFFPELMPGSAISVPSSFLETWNSGYFTTTIEPVIADTTSATKVNQLLNVTSVSPYTYAPPTSTQSIEEVLGYNAFATNDGIAKLGGQPFDNQHREYSGTDDDPELNETVDRFTADQAALDEIAAHYQTTGKLSVPLVTLHTTGDEVVPDWHAGLYRDKVEAAHKGLFYRHFEVDRHGHCAFEYSDILGAFTTLVEMVDNPPTRVFLPSVVKAP